MQEPSTPRIPEYLDCAAFLVENNLITQANPSAINHGVSVGANILDMIRIGSQEYTSFQSGKLYLQLDIAGMNHHAGVTIHEGAHLFCIHSNYESSELQALALASSHLREPLQKALMGIELLTNKLTDDESDALSPQINQINHGLHQLLRTIGNMSDASSFPQIRLSLFEYLDMQSLFWEFSETLRAYSPNLNRTFRFSGPGKPVYTMADRQALERAFYNLISNAVKFSPAGSTINITMSAEGKRLQFTVENVCESTSIPAVQYFDRYLRKPGIEDLRYGIGLGLPVIRTIAFAHRGTLLVMPAKSGKITFTMSIAIQNNNAHVLNAPNGFRLNITGGYDTSLVELSDVLTNDMYATD